MERKICVVTGTRAEFGLLYWLIKAIQEDTDLILQLLVTGMHLSPEFGLTYQEITEAGFKIDKKIENLLSSDTPIGISKSMGLAQISCAEAFDELKPDIIVVLGDRFEIFSAVASAMIGRIPIAHLHGGESTEGLIDEPIRHSITKMSQLHFTATEAYRKRVIQLGEQPSRVFNVGTPGLDNIYKLRLLSREQFEKSINFKLGKRNIIITFHPVTLEFSTSRKQFQNILDVLDQLKETKIIFTKPNADTDGRIIINMIDEYVARNLDKACSFVSLGQLRYLSALRHVDAIVGNSSSGLTEAPSFKIATINIGDRQRGRVKSGNVIDCQPEQASISNALSLVYSKRFQERLKTVTNSYGKGGASEKIRDILKNVDLSKIIKKKFYDLPVV